MIKVLIADHDPAARGRLAGLVAAKTDFKIIGECSDGARALDLIELLNPDLVFIDAELPKMGGFEVVQAARPAKRPYIVFVAASDRHALQAFDADALDYVLKPADQDRLELTLSRVRKCLERDARYDSKVDVVDLLAYLRSHNTKSPAMRGAERVPIKFGRRHRFINISAIHSVLARNHYVELHMSTGEVLHASDRISEMEKKLPPECFLRVSRSAIINITHVQEVLSEKNGYRIAMSDKTHFKAGSTYKSKVRKVLMAGRRPQPAPDLAETLIGEMMRE